MNQQIPIGLSTTLKVLTAAAALLLIYYLRDVLLPFAVAFVLAYILNPAVAIISKYTRKRWIAVVITLLLSLAIFAGAAMLFVPALLHEARHLYTLLNEKNLLAEWRDVMPELATRFMESIGSDEGLAAILNSDSFGQVLEQVLPRAASFFSKTFNAVYSALGFAIVILYLIFIMLDFSSITKGIENMIPAKYREQSLHFLKRFTTEVGKYFRGQILIVIAVTVLYSLGFWAVGLPLGVMLGLLVGALNIVPYLQIAGFLPALLLCFVKSMEDGTPAWMVILSVAAVFVTVQILQDMIITPKIMGKTTGLNPAMILLSLSVWGKLLGFLGLIAAIPFSCLVKAYYAEFLKKREAQDEKADNN